MKVAIKQVTDNLIAKHICSADLSYVPPKWTRRDLNPQPVNALLPTRDLTVIIE